MIPSYDDLTPGIPDVLASEGVSQLALFLRDDLQPAAVSTPPGPAVQRDPDALYACVRGTPRDGLLAIARAFSPRVMVASPGEVLLDVSGLGRLIGDPPAIAGALVAAIADAGVEATVAIAPTQTAARLAAMAAEAGQRPGAVAAMADLEPSPVVRLRELETLPPAMNHRDRARPYEIFERWGIATLGDLAALPAAELSSRLGRRGVALQRLARGLDPRPFVPDGETPRYIARLELEWPIEALEPLSFVLARLLEPLSTALERADRGAAAIRLELRLTTRATHLRRLALPAAMRDPRVLRTLLLLDLESHPAPAAVDIVSIELDPAPARITQFSLLARAIPSPETLSTLTARLSALVGELRVGSAVLLDTHRPDGFAMTPFAPDGVGRRAPAPDEPGLPDPACGDDARHALVLRRQRTPPAIRVRVAGGRPAHIAAARRGMPAGSVIQAAGPWRTAGGWWTSSDPGRAGADPAPSVPPAAGADWALARGWNRDEWDVALADGTVGRIFQDRTTRRWFLEGVYD